MSLDKANVINDAFHRKAMKWQSRLKDELAVLRIAKNNAKLDECSFRPNIHQNFVHNDVRNQKDDRTQHALFKHRWSDETHHRSDRAQLRCEQMYEEGLAKAAMVDEIQRQAAKMREETDMSECTFKPAVFKLEQAKRAKEERAALKLKGKAMLGRASPSSINTSAETVDTYTRLSFDPRQHFASPEKNPSTRWNDGKKLTKDQFEANFLTRQNKYANIREERMRQTQEDLDNKLFRPARGKGHWLKSYARSKRIAKEYLENSSKEDLRLRTPSFWDRPSWARGHSIWGGPKQRGGKPLPPREEGDDTKGKRGKRPPPPPKTPPPAFVGSANAQRRSSTEAGGPSLYQANLHQKLLENSVPDVEDFKMTTETVDGFLDFCIFVYSEGENERIALSDIFEFFLVSQRSFYRFKHHPVADGIEILLRHLSTLVFQGFETGPEEWLKCLKKKGESVDEMAVSHSEFMESVKLMLSHNQMEDQEVGQTLNEIGRGIVAGYLGDVTSSLFSARGAEVWMSGVVLIDVVNHYYMEDKRLLRRKEEVEASAACIELCLARRGIDVMRMFSAEDLDRDGSLTFDEVRRSLLKIKEVLDVKHDHADLMRAMAGLKGESLDDTNDVTSDVDGGDVKVIAGDSPSSKSRRKAQQSKSSPTRSRPAPMLKSTRSIRSVSMASLASHRTEADPLHMTRQQHRETKLYDTVMGMLASQESAEEKKRAFQPTTNVSRREGGDKDKDNEKENDGGVLMTSFLEKLGMEDSEEKVVSRKRKSRNESTGEEVADKLGDISSIGREDDDDDDNSGSQKLLPPPPSRPAKPKVLDTHAHSHQSEFQKLHKQKADKKQDRLLRTIESIIPNKVDETLMEEELALLAGRIVGDHPQPNLHPTYSEQQEAVTKLSQPLEKNKYVPPPPVPKEYQNAYSNTTGRQRPPPDAEPAALEKFKRKLPRAKINEWVEGQYSKMAIKKLENDTAYESQIKEATSHKFRVSDASLAMAHEPAKTFEELYEEGVRYVQDRKKENGAPSSNFAVGRSREGKGIRDTCGGWLSIKPVSEMSMKPSEFSHTPRSHLENEVTVKILSEKKKNRGKDSFMRPLTPPPPVIYPFSPTMPEGSEEIVANDPSYNYKKREKDRVDAWVRKYTAQKAEECDVRRRSMLEFTDAVPKTLEGSPKKRGKETIRRIEERKARFEKL